MINPTEVFVLIRYSGERTFSLCQKLIENEVPLSCIYVTPIHSTFNECFVYSITQAIEKERLYTIFIDADILIRPGSLSGLVNKFKSLDGQYGCINSFTLDKFHLGKKSGGVHIYRTSALKLVFNDLQSFINEQRPETEAKNIIHQKYGLKIFHWDQITCFHDFFQFRKDIIRKVSFRKLKSSHLLPTYLGYYKLLKFISSDYDLAYRVLNAKRINFNNKSSSENIELFRFKIVEKDIFISKSAFLLFESKIPFYFWIFVFKFFRWLSR